jgi:LysM repeat protein
MSLTGAPSVVVNGHLLNDYQYETISSAIDGAVAAKSAVPSITFAAGTTTAPGASPTAARSPSTTATFIVYVVRSGDTLSAISNRFNVTLAQLWAANPQIPANGHIEVGQLINVPPPA